MRQIEQTLSKFKPQSEKVSERRAENDIESHTKWDKWSKWNRFKIRVGMQFQAQVENTMKEQTQKCLSSACNWVCLCVRARAHYADVNDEINGHLAGKGHFLTGEIIILWTNQRAFKLLFEISTRQAGANINVRVTVCVCGRLQMPLWLRLVFFSVYVHLC